MVEANGPIGSEVSISFQFHALMKHLALILSQISFLILFSLNSIKRNMFNAFTP
jgi:hypothetical protein